MDRYNIRGIPDSGDSMKAKRGHTKFGMTTVYPGQKPEDIFSLAELEAWAIRNGWKRPVIVERFNALGKGQK